MPAAFRLALFAALLGTLAACTGSAGPPRRVWPPQPSIQEMTVQADGSWTLRVRIQNISTVPMRYERVEATLRIAQFEAGRLSLMPGVSVGPNSAETVETTLIPNAEAARAVQDALSSGRGVRYAFEGEIASSDPRRTDRFTHQSVLSPVPGLDGVLR